MGVRAVEGIAEFRAALAVNVRAWRAAYEGILPAAVLDGMTVPEGEDLRERWAAQRDRDAAFLVAVDPDDPAGAAPVGDESGAASDGDGSASDGVPPAEDESGAADAVVGFAEFVWDDGATKTFVDPGEAELRAVYVEPSLWGEGVGTRLLERGTDALADGREVLALEAFADNDVGRSFYESRGFERVGESTFEVAGEAYPSVVYEKRLRSR